MMNIKSLEAAILARDPDGVVEALSDWDEQQRRAAREPFNLFMAALGLNDNVVKPGDLPRDHPDVVAKRERDGIVEMSREDHAHYYDMYYLTRLGRYGLESLEYCKQSLKVPHYLPESAQIMADRKPPWWNEWYDAVTLDEDGCGILPEFWALLYEHRMVTVDDFGRMAPYFEHGLPGAIASSPQAVQKVMREIEGCRDVIYDARKNTYQLFHASEWIPVIEWLRGQKLLDASRLLAAMLDALHEPLNQAERNGAVMLAKAVKANGKVLAEHQSRWSGLVPDSQSSVAGFAVQQLAKIQKAGLLDAKEAITALPNIFSHKPKTHAKTAVEMLGRIADDESLRPQAVEAVATGLMHPNKDVQKATLQILRERLRADDTAAIESIQLYSSSVAATLASDVEKLLRFAGDAPSEEPSEEPPASDQASDMADRFKQSFEEISPSVRKLLRLDEALAAAKEARVDLTASWSIRDVKILAMAEPIRPIETVEELIEVTSAAIERCECPDTADRIISGIVRLYRERPESFDTMAESLHNRACAGIYDRPQRGIVGGQLGNPFSLLIGAWLRVERDKGDFDLFTDAVQCYLAELSKHVRAGTATPLLSEATHAGGWIDPRVWVKRLIQWQADQTDQADQVEHSDDNKLFEDDLVRSLLRLTPDGRDEALKLCESLTAPLKGPATAALGGEIIIDDSSTPQVWITALRARDAWINLMDQLTPDEQAIIPDELKKLPDVVYPANYQWNVRERTTKTACQDLIDAWPTQEDRPETEVKTNNLMAQLLGSFRDNDDVFEAISRIADGQSQTQSDEFFTVALHHLSCNWAPPFAYPYMATQWPMKLDWYWCLATRGFSSRAESNSSVDEPYGQFLLPLLEIDRPLTKMAARALWIATVGKDPSSRSMAVEVWIALVETDRVDVAMLVAALREISQGGWVKPNRISEALGEVSAVSPLHAWAVADVLEAFLTGCEQFPRGVAPLLELLDECCQQIGRAVSEGLRQSLPSIKSGKAKTAAKSLLNRVDQVTADRQTAVTTALEARLARSRRLDNVEGKQR